MMSGLLVLCLLSLILPVVRAQSCGSNNPCEASPEDCLVDKPPARCRGDTFALATNAASSGWLQAWNQASGGTLYYCCGANCDCNSADSCLRSGLWKNAESTGGFLRLARTRANVCGDNEADLDDCGWRFERLQLTYDVAVDQCHFNVFWCRDCRDTDYPNPQTNSPGCGGRQLSCGTASGLSPCTGAICGPNCAGRAKWADDEDRPMRSAATLTLRNPLQNSPQNVVSSVGDSGVFSVSFSTECGMTSLAWYRCDVGASCNPGDGTLVGSSEGAISTSFPTGGIDSTLTLSNVQLSISGRRYYAVACPGSCGGTCSASCPRAYWSSSALLSVCGAAGTPPGVSVHPADFGAVIGTSASLSATASLTFQAVRWERRIGTGSWQPFSAGTSTINGLTATLTFPTLAEYDGNRFRATFNNCGAESTSNAARMCARHLPCVFRISDGFAYAGWDAPMCATHASGSNSDACANPSSTLVAEPCDFSTVPDSAVWEISVDGGVTWTAADPGKVSGLPLGIGGQTTVSVPTRPDAAGPNPLVRFSVSTCAGTRVSNVASVSVSCVTADVRRQDVVQNPSDVIVAWNSPFSFEARAEENPNDSYVRDSRWESRASFSDEWQLVDTTSPTSPWTKTLVGPVATLSHSGATADLNGRQFRMRFCNCDTESSNSAECMANYPLQSSEIFTVTLTCPPTGCPPLIITSPLDVLTVPGETATFSATSTNNPAITSVVWQRNTGSGWQTQNFPSSTVTGSLSSTTLTIPNAQTSMSDDRVRVRFTNSLGQAVSREARLRVVSLPSNCNPGSCGGSDGYGRTPENCGSSGTGCSFRCSGCGSCTAVLNPEFSKQCEANIVLILDESGSISGFTTFVRNGVKQFLLSFSQTTTLGGTANLGVVEFDSSARLVTTGGNSGKMAPLDSSWVAALTGYVDNTRTGDETDGYTPGGCTNWGAAIARGLRPTGGSSSWQVRSGASSWVNQNPDVILIFTDGKPTFHQTDTCDYHCNYRRVKPDGNIVGPCNGGDIGWSCFNADIVKSAGVKIFLVGVGDVSNNVPTVQLLTGPRSWDLQSTTFFNADYVINNDYAALGNLFLEVVRGLCTCLQTTPVCAGTVNQCAATLFSARVRVTTTSDRADRSTFPPGSTTAAYLYYRYDPSPDTRVAYQFFDPAQDVTAATPNLIRSDLLDPCTIRRQVRCGDGCYSVSERQDLPRFFREQYDTQDLSGAFWPMPAGCSAGYRKNYPTPPFGASVSDLMVKYLYVLSDGITPCAAETFDRTLFEFFSDAGATRGVRNLGSQPQVIQPNTLAAGTFSFAVNTTCAAATCGRDVELVFVIDESDLESQQDYLNSLLFVARTITTFNLNDNGVRFGIVWTNPVSEPGLPTTLQSGGTSIITQVLFPGASITMPGYQLSGGFPRPRGRGTANFATQIMYALDKYWPVNGGSTGIKREIITIVGSADAGTDPNRFARLQAEFIARNVEAFSIGIGELGAYSIGLLANISSPSTSFVHYQSYASSQFLVDQVSLIAPIYCPQGNLCGSDCAGFCACASVDSCSCPTCRSTACTPRTCPGASSGCVDQPQPTCTDSLGLCTKKECVEPVIGCRITPTVVCNDFNNCTNDRCVPSTGQCEYLAVATEDGDRCTTGQCLPNGTIAQNPIPCPESNECYMFACNSTTGSCDFSSPVCQDNDECTVDSCNNATGCVHDPVTDVVSVCGSRSCQIAACVPGTGGCSFTNDPSPSCSCELFPCTNQTFCTSPVCMSTNTECDSLPSELEQSACKIALASDSTRRFCYDQPIPDVCTPSNECFDVVCVNGAGQSGSCVTTPTGDRCVADLCTLPICNNQTGCGVVPKAPEDIALLCNDNSKCTEDSCVNGQCRYDTIPCTTNDKCLIAECDPIRGCEVRSKNSVELRAVCDDSNACTTDTCVNNTCIYTFDVVCTPDDACNQYRCNPATGDCDVTETVCNDGNECTDDTCDSVNGCQYRNLTQAEINIQCRPTSCQQATCETQCVVAPLDPLPPVCGGNPCDFSPCPNPVLNNCVRTECFVASSQCDVVPAGAQRTECVTNVTSDGRFCYNLPLDPCPASTNCTTYTCQPNGPCLMTDIGALCTSNDICKLPTCIASGCALVNKSDSDIAKLCNDNNECTVDSCLDNACVYTNVSDACTTDNKCKVAFCDPLVSGGCVTRDKTEAEVALVCDDMNACTTDTCVNGECVYTYTANCPASDNCTTWSCNTTSGDCFSTTKTCNDFNKCTADSCQGDFPGGCRYELITSPAELARELVCNTSSCQIATCSLDNNGTCSFQPSQTPSCACVNFPCDNRKYCTDPVCLTSCASLSGSELSACEAAVANASFPFHNRYCYDRPNSNKLQCESRSDLCTQYSCVNGAGQSGSCESAPTGIVCDPGDKCMQARCDGTLGCVYERKDSLVLAALCDDNNACTADDCEANECVYRDTSSSCGDNGDKCVVGFCNSATGCETRPKTPNELLDVCNDNNACTTDTCVDNTCAYSVSVSCPPNDACNSYSCNPVTGLCDRVRTDCNDMNPCTIDTCNNATGCVYTPRTQAEINQLCGPGSCQNATCVTQCELFNVTEGVCSDNPCVANPCPGTTDNFCFRDVCINAASGSGITCEVVPIGSERDACVSNVTSSNRYCFLLPKSPCPSDTTCTTYQCNPAGQGSCDATNVGVGVNCLSNDICLEPTCSDSAGCGLVSKPDAVIASLCNDNNACTVDSCANNACVYTPVTCPEPTDKCLEAFCVASSGCGTRKKNSTAIAALCDDNNLCTRDDCSAGVCTYAPSVTCPDNNACSSYACNATSGQCVETKTVCNDGDQCTTDECDPLSGCRYSPLTQTQVDALCNPGTCKVATCPVGTNQCNVTSDLSAVCACDEFPCTNPATFCTIPRCVNSLSGCSNLPSALQLSCILQVQTTGSPKRFCADVPLDVCDASTLCKRYTCNATASACDVEDLGAACTSSDICRKPSCLPDSGCTTVAKTPTEVAQVCNDNNACTIDTCSGNQCIYTPRSCPEPTDKCLEAVCNPATGCGTRQKNATAIAALCNDNNLCTADTCSSNTCRYQSSVSCTVSDACNQYQCNALTGLCDLTKTECNDQNECTIDTCNPSSGCVYTPRTQAQINQLCRPGPCQQASCTTGCVNSPLTPVPPACNSNPCISNPCPVYIDTFCERTICINQANGTGVSCDQVPSGPLKDECVANTTTAGRFCFLQPLSPCQPNTQCTTYTCDSASGTCLSTNIGVGVNCVSNDICKRATCDPVGGCGSVNKTASVIAALCDDNNKCTVDKCANNQCVYEPVVCPASTDQCVESFCAPSTGCGFRQKNASSIAALCNDNNQCTSDRCVAGACVYESIVTCPPSNACSQYSCNPLTGLCDVVQTTCNDQNACTRDSCNPLTGCVYTPITCNDNSNCTIDSCNVTTGCVYTPRICSSGSKCTVDTCNPATGCVYSTIVCNDNNFATTDSCDPVSGCVYTPIVCNDLNNCTQDRVTANGCVYTPITCNDGNICTDDTCVAPTGCVYTPRDCTPPDPICFTGACDESSGACRAFPVECDDGNACTIDSCNATLGGCQYTPFNCSGISTCFVYGCQANNVTGDPECVVLRALDCSDGDSCTSDSCVEGQGCQHLNITCQATAACNFPVGCDGSGPEPNCIMQNITTLFDFCGVCLGDNTACFFSSIVPVSSIAGISAGAAAGIALAAILGVLLAAWFSKKGYDYYKSASDNAAASMQTNPYFVSNQMAGEMMV